MTLGGPARARCRIAALACTLLFIAACAAAEGAAGLEVRLRRLDEPQVQARNVGKLELLAAYHLDGPSNFGGLSALLLDREFLFLLSDRGRLFRARRVEDATGRLTGLRDWADLPLPAAVRDADTEALTRQADGSLVIGAEGGRRLFRLAAADGRQAAVPIPLPAFLRDLPDNQGVEALATLPDGGLLAVSEGAFERPEVVTAGILGAKKDAVRLGVRAPDGFRPTGADVAGDTLFLLERRLSLLGGLEARLVAVPLRDVGTAGNLPLDGEELARFGAGSFSENFEGVAVRRAEDGGYVIYLVADDNFSALQRTLLLQLAWRPGRAKAERR